ncbi:MAG: GNAT family N-acetyltransferase [Jaaginema sp. PMC 1079.18]|nr:GNAT family N-acetyltransferase [Jaaginema sp. PMC 1080.18]MEC4853950.1 GNAT family N-acetyltransferase [Jaaginema sp. PMC 1079.18]
MITYYLEMTNREQLQVRGETVRDLDIRECVICQPKLNRFLYEYVGKKWQWCDKLSWSSSQWQNYVCDENLRTFLALKQGAIAGYYELQYQPGDNVEIAYFGLAPEFINQGYGGFLLTQALQNAWNWHSCQRVWVHTCTNDHPQALRNYLKSGFAVYCTEEIPN